MQIRLANTSGFCFGVERAVNMVIKALDGSHGVIYTLGPVIHNEQMMQYLRQKGVTAIDSVSDIKDPGGTLVIRAHGVAPEVYDEIMAKGFFIIDATCPYVKKIHDLVRDRSGKGYRIFIAGDRNHPEVIGINGWASNNAVIFADETETKCIEGSSEKCFLVAQTTLTRDGWNKIADSLQGKFSNLERFDTICNATVQRFNEACEIARSSDTVIVVGGRNSSNTSKLFEACGKYCSDTHLIETADEIKDIRFTSGEKVGITAGASTPKWVIEEVMEKVRFLDTDENDIDFVKAFEESLLKLHQGDVVKGRIISFNGSEFFVDVGYKADGIIPLNEYTDDPLFNAADAPKKGEEIEVLVVRVNDGEGNVLLSKRKVDSVNIMKEIEKAYEDKQTLHVRLFEAISGGLLGYFKGVRIFIPASQLGLKYVKDLAGLVGRDLDIRIIELNAQKRRIIGSQRVLLEEGRSRNAMDLWNTVQPGIKIKGIVKSFAEFGAFIDLGGLDGLIHISELSWHKVKHPSELLKIGDQVEVTVLNFDKEKKRISLKLKKDEDDPWIGAADKYKVGDVITGKVIRLVPFGAFVEIERGVDGLVHISQITGRRISKPEEVLHIGDEVQARIIEMNTDARKMNLSIREADTQEENLQI